MRVGTSHEISRKSLPRQEVVEEQHATRDGNVGHSSRKCVSLITERLFLIAGEKGGDMLGW